MDKILKILFVEDVIRDAELIWREIERCGIAFNKLLVDNKKDFLKGLKSFNPDLIISDYRLPQFDGMKALSLRNELSPLTPFILVTGSINEEVAVECMKAGADDYILKENLSRLGPAVINSLNKIELLKQKNDTETALRESEERFRILYSDAVVGLYRTNLQGDIILANRALVNMLGFQSFEELALRNLKEAGYGPLYQRQQFIDVIEKDGEVKDLEAIWICRNGKAIFVRESAKAIFDSEGKIIYYDGTVEDITERKRAEQELKQSYDFTESLLKTIPFGMDIVDEEGTVLFLSDNFKRLFGEKAIGKKCWDLYRDDKKQCSDCPLTRGISIGETEAYESHGVLGNRIFEISHTGMMYQGKEAMLEIFLDITNRKKNEEELIRAKEKAEESDRLKTAFLHNISHEIRTPLNAIVGFCTLIGEPDVDTRTQKTYIEVIMQSSNHLLAIITDIIDISNIEANLVKIVKNGINLNAALKSLCKQFIPEADKKKIKLICETGLSDSNALVLTDSTKLIQILSNLINNALKFTDKGYIKVWYKVKGKFLEFCVSDTGIGILQEYHKRIFDRFYQVQYTDTRIYEGTGLGLSIAKAYADLMGGKIRLESEPGKGTSFYLSIPFERPESAVKAASKIKMSEKPELKTKKTILIAEDIESNFHLLEYFLSDSNIEILKAENGKEAVEIAFAKKNIDLILMDIKMPVMDGYTATRLIREANITTPIIAQTAYADDRYRSIEGGFNGFISKPFDKKTLLKALTEFI